MAVRVSLAFLIACGARMPDLSGNFEKCQPELCIRCLCSAAGLRRSFDHYPASTLTLCNLIPEKSKLDANEGYD